MKTTHEMARIAMAEYQALRHRAQKYVEAELFDSEDPREPDPDQLRVEMELILPYLVRLYCQEKHSETMFDVALGRTDERTD